MVTLHSGGSKGGGGVRGVRTPLRFPGKNVCTWKITFMINDCNNKCGPNVKSKSFQTLLQIIYLAPMKSYLVIICLTLQVKLDNWTTFYEWYEADYEAELVQETKKKIL